LQTRLLDIKSPSSLSVERGVDDPLLAAAMLAERSGRWRVD